MIGLMMAAALATGAVTAQPWQRYGNAHYGYSTCYPPKAFRPQGESDAGDGQSFKAADGAEIRAWGGYAVDGTPSAQFADEMKQLSADLSGKTGKVTYRVDRPGWTVFSGRSGSTIFWVKGMRQGDRIVTVQFTYPAARMAAYQAIPGTLNRCSSIGTAAF